MSFSLISVVGPTASGKTSLAIALASELCRSGKPVEIINADAMQLYAGMDIGTAKLPQAERGGIPHHLFDVITPDAEMTAVAYKELARAKSESLLGQGITPMFVGGSMFYLAAALDNLDFAPTDLELRSRLEEESLRIGAMAMHDRLSQLDPITAGKIPAQNIRRVIRALEVIGITGEPYGSSLPEPVYWKPTLQIGIAVERELLKERIVQRVDQMWADGIVAEASELLRNQPLGKTARMAIGYKQAIAQLSGEMSESEAKAETVSLTQRYARRQMSWFRRDKRIKWISADGDLLEQAQDLIRLEP